MINLLIVGDFSPRARLSRLHDMAPADVLGTFHEKVRGADLAMLNLEAPLCRPEAPIVKTGPSLHSPPETARFIANSGFDLACLANNHIMDYGADGLSETMATLEHHDIAWTGAGTDLAAASQPSIHEVRGGTIAILNFAENEWSTTGGEQAGACPIDPIRNHRVIRRCRESADHVIVVSHGGHERHRLPSPGMRELFHFYVECGADAVVNHHTHCTSGYEVYQGAPIFYSVGNFLFDSSHDKSGPWTQGMAVELHLRTKSIDFSLHHFNQCTADTLFEIVDENEASRRNKQIQQLNQVIEDPADLETAFAELVSQRQREYQSYLEPRFSRLISAAQRRGWLPSFIRHRHRALLLNLIRCESHRELLIELLKRDIDRRC